MAQRRTDCSARALLRLRRGMRWQSLGGRGGRPSGSALWGGASAEPVGPARPVGAVALWCEARPSPLAGSRAPCALEAAVR